MYFLYFDYFLAEHAVIIHHYLALLYLQDDTTSSLLSENKSLRIKIASLENEMNQLVPKLDFGSIVEDSDKKLRQSYRDSENDTGRHIADTDFDTARANDGINEKLRVSAEEIESLKIQVSSQSRHSK